MARQLRDFSDLMAKTDRERPKFADGDWVSPPPELHKRFSQAVASRVHCFQEKLGKDGGILKEGFRLESFHQKPTAALVSGIPTAPDTIAYHPIEWVDDDSEKKRLEKKSLLQSDATGNLHWKVESNRVEGSGSYLAMASYAEVMNSIDAALAEAWCYHKGYSGPKHLKDKEKKVKQILELLAEPVFKLSKPSAFRTHADWKGDKTFKAGVTVYFQFMSEYAQHAHWDNRGFPLHENCLCDKCSAVLSIPKINLKHWECQGCVECVSRKHMDVKASLPLFAVFYPEYGEKAKEMFEDLKYANEKRKQARAADPLGLFE